MTTHHGKTHIVHLTSVHPPFDTRIFHKECRSLVEAGFQVTLIAPHTHDEVVDGVQIAAIRKSRGRLQRMTSGIGAVYRRARKLDADLYQIHDPELLPVALLLQGLTGVPTIYDAHEYLARDVSQKEWLPRPVARPLSRIVDVVEKESARRLAGVVTVNPHLAAQFRKVNPRVAVVANFPHMTLAQMPLEGTGEADTILYLGMIGAQRGYELLLEAIQQVRVRRPGAICRILGDLDPLLVKPDLLALTPHELFTRGIEFLPKVPYDEVPALVAKYRLGWLPWKSTPGQLYGIPTKLLEYMALARPVVASDLPFVRRIISESQCGIIVPWDSPEAHADALLYLLEHPEDATRLGENGRSSVLKKLNWESQIQALLSLYELCIMTPTPRAVSKSLQLTEGVREDHR